MKIRTKLIINMVCFGAALLSIAGLMVNTGQQVERLNKQEELAKNIELTVNEFSYLWNDYLFYHETQQIGRMELKLSSISADLSKITVDNPEQKMLVEHIKVNLQRLEEVYREVVPKIERAVPTQPNSVDSAFIQVSWSRMGVQTQGIIFKVSLLEQQFRKEVNWTKERNNLFILALITALVAFLLADYLLVFRRILKSILNLQLGTRIIGSGNLDFFIEVKKADEIGELTDAFNQMTANLKIVTDREQETNSILASERELLKVTLNSLKEGVIVIDQSERIIFINKAAANLTGFSHNEAFGELISKILYIVNDTTSGPIDIFQTQAGNQSPILVTRDSREIAISLNSTVIISTNGQTTGTVIVLVDITEKQKTEQEMLKAAKLESLGILAGGVAHDFNNILAGILANLQLAMAKLKKHQDISNYMKTTIEITRKASDLTKQLLTFAKGGDPVKKSTTIKNLVKDTVQFALSGSKIKAEFHLPEDLWTVDIDEGQIAQVINNLTINAEQAMPSGGILEIYGRNVTYDDMNQYTSGQYVKLTVKDHGIGIPPEIIDKIFDPFFTTKKTGNGLGLSTSYSIIKKHDGYLGVESAPGIGTTFYILLPTSLKELNWNEPKTEIAASGEAKILLMDDEDAIRNVGGEMLFYYGYQVTLARDGREAVELYKQARENGEPYDVVIMDLTVPGSLGGIETMAILRQIDPEVKAIISSGYVSDPVMSNYERYGFKGVVTKPYKFEELIEVLNQVIDRKQLPLDFNF